MAKFKTTPQTPKDDLLKKGPFIPKTTSETKKAPSAVTSSSQPTKSEKTQTGGERKKGCGIGIGGCFLGTCLGILLTLVIIIVGIFFAGQNLLKRLSPELMKRLSTQEGVSEFLESLQSEEGFRKFFEEGFPKDSPPFPLPTPKEFEESSPSASPSAQPGYFPFETTP